MRSTRATAAVERLKVRSGNRLYSMVRTVDGLFYLVLPDTAGGSPNKLGEALELDAFVSFVNTLGPQVPKRLTKMDVAFERQLRGKKSGS